VTADPRQILREFSELPEEEKREVLAELLRITRERDQPDAGEEELLAKAEEILRRER
jgi:RNA polymerase-interacting CarD/CdnL/TRCF family regulator